MVPEITFAQWLKSRRRMLDLTQQALAELVNCSVETIYRIEAGQRRPSAQVARLLGKALNVPENERDAFTRFARASEPAKIHSLHSEAAPWRDTFIPTNNLPVQLTTLIGREQHVRDAIARLRQDDVRLLTLIGPPGIGKTRMAIQLGYEVVLDFPEGVHFVELASFTQPDRMISAITATLDISLADRKKPVDGLIAYLYERRQLLIFDNFEQILEAAAYVNAILVACPLVKVVVTSRTPLQLRGERLFPIEPLALPGRIDDVTVHGLAGFAAVQLFVERARAVQPGFALTEENSAIVAAICAGLDGIPLAIEIAAAQTLVLHPDEILDHLTGARLLNSPGMVDSDSRHHSLNAAISWSYQLLNEAEQAFFRRLGVFVDGGQLDAVEAVCQPEYDVLTVLTKLVRMNLLKRETGANRTSRFRMLEVIREYARVELQTRGEWAEIQARHAAYYRDFARAHEESVRSSGQVEGLEQVESEHVNLQAALDYFLAAQSWKDGLDLAGTLIEFWVYHNHLITGLYYLTALLNEAADDPALQAGRARALNGAAMMSYFAGDFASIGPYAEAALASAQAINSHQQIAFACITLGMKSGGMGNFDAAVRYFEQGRAAAEQTNIPWEMASLLNGFGEVSRSQGRYEEAQTYYSDALQIAEKMGNLWLCAHILDNIGHAAYVQGHYDMANTYIRQSMKASVALRDERGIAMCLEKLGGIAITKEQFELAANLLGAAEALRKAKNTPVEGMDALDYNRSVVALREQLSPQTREAAWQAGQEFSLAEIMGLTEGV